MPSQDIKPGFSHQPEAPARGRRKILPRWRFGLVTGVVGFTAALLCSLGLAALVRGTWADTEPLMPASVEAGPVCHLYQMPGEGKQVRCAMLLPYSLDRVWQAVTDYDNYGDICSYVHAGDLTYDPNGTLHVEGSAQSILTRDIPFAADIHHEQMLDRYRTTWDQSSGDVLVNRGHWILTPTGPSETLLELTLEVQMRNIPTFILRNISMHRLPEVVRAVESRLRTNGPGKQWRGEG
jgi:hypothetical protein